MKLQRNEPAAVQSVKSRSRWQAAEEWIRTITGWYACVHICLCMHTHTCTHTCTHSIWICGIPPVYILLLMCPCLVALAWLLPPWNIHIDSKSPNMRVSNCRCVQKQSSVIHARHFTTDILWVAGVSVCPGATPASLEPCDNQHRVPGSHPSVAAAGDNLCSAVLSCAAYARPHAPLLSHGLDLTLWNSYSFLFSVLVFLSLCLLYSLFSLLFFLLLSYIHLFISFFCPSVFFPSIHTFVAFIYLFIH